MPSPIRAPHAGGLARALAAAALLLAGSSPAATLYVSTAGSNAGNCQTVGTPCQTITYALSQAAAAGDSIDIAAGTYTEELTIAKSVVLNGAGMASTLIKAPAVLTTNPAVPGGSPGQQTTIVFVTGAATVATMQNLQVQGPGATACGSIGYGVFVGGGARLNFSNNHVLMIRDNSTPLSGCQNGSALRYGAPSTAQSATGSISNNIIDTYQKNGITVSNTGTVVTIADNSVTGELPPPNTAQNGIQVSSGAVATVSGNFVSNNQCAAPGCGPGFGDTWATGILLFDAGAGTSVSNNTVSHNDGGLVNVATAANPPTLSATGNTFGDNRYAGVLVAGTSMTLTNNGVTGGNYGIVAQASSPTSTVITLAGGNSVRSALIAGVTVVDDDLADAITATVQGSGNQFVGNATGAANTPSQGTLNLSCNWWGSAYGPINAGNPLGQGNPATANTVFTNWAINNSDFLCIGNPQNNLLLAAPAISVPAGTPWSSAALATLLLLVACAAVGRRRAYQRGG